MADWVTYAIPLIALVIWILSNLSKGNEPQKKPPVGGGGGRQAAPPPPRHGQEPDEVLPAGPGRKEKIEQFLQEINERRRQREEGIEPARPAAPATPPPPPKPRPAPTVVRVERPPPPPRVAQALPAEPILEALPSAAVDLPLGAPLTAQEARIAPPLLADRGPPLPSHVAFLRTLLKSPRGLRTAVLLQEILGPPRSRKRWR